MEGILNVSIVTYHTDPEELARCLRSLDTPAVKTVYIIDNSAYEVPSHHLKDPKDPKDPKHPKDLKHLNHLNHLKDLNHLNRLKALKSEIGALPETILSRVCYIPSRNVGYGAGHNLALRRTLEKEGERGAAEEAPYHLVLNSDVYFEPATLERLLAVMEAHPDFGQLQPRICNPDGSLQYTVRMLPTPLDLIGRRFLPAALMRRRNDRYLLKHLDLGEPQNVPYHQGSFMLLRADALRQSGIFDERFFMYPEDIDLTRRVHAVAKTMYWPAESVVHAHRQASYKSWKMLRIHMVNMMRYFNKWGWWCDRRRRRFNAPLRR